MNEPITYKRVKVWDDDLEHSIKELAISLHGEATTDVASPLDLDRLIEIAKLYVPDSRERALFTAERYVPEVKDSLIIGVMASKISQKYYSKNTFAENIVWLVDPDERKTALTVGFNLLQMLVDWGRERGVDEINISQDSAINSTSFNKMMEHRGYNFVGCNYRMELNQ